MFSRLIIALCRSKVLQKAPMHSAILSTCTKLPLLFCLFLIGHLIKIGFPVCLYEPSYEILVLIRYAF